MDVKEYVKNHWLTWRTGKDRATREWDSWYELTVNYRANDITDMFKNFRYVIVVDPDRFFQYDPFAWVPCKDAKQYFWPIRLPEESCVWRFERVIWNEWDQRWHINELGGKDQVFVATNNENDAIMISLRWT